MTCPVCQGETQRKYRPFCSARCADIDLARWLRGSYAIPGAPAEEDEIEQPGDGPFPRHS